ncbi:Abortive infection bacteriophage resistance protein [Cetobacterium ceti]|uniref:Abortive infection bacteriophage resistance protein n=1 Tax=Cetobacterium ceti TaxID=180163 RepID=A0A1T4PVD0_9FUSO|nr:Abi family protein [Cetobacterium ceti]SJZ95475.1 Abortive infection bacteriophage resistance protein [Cetobacterium ceti]
MSVICDRPFKTYKEQLEILEKKYLLEINRNKFELNILSSISYYDLVNGYKDCFMVNEKYKKGITKQYLFQFLIFDKNIQNLLFKYSVYTENTFKTKLAYVISKNIGEHENIYLNKQNYARVRNKNKRQQLYHLLIRMKKCLETITDNPTKHYNDTHNHVPPWILFKNIKFSKIIDLYGFLETNSKQEFVSEYFENGVLKYEENAEMLKKMITIVRKFRNKIAHNSKVVNYYVENDYELNRQKLLRIIPREIYHVKDVQEARGSNDLFAMILSLVKLLGNNYLILLFIQELYFLFSSDDIIAKEYIKLTNLPDDLLERLEKLKEVYSVELEKDIYTLL